MIHYNYAESTRNIQNAKKYPPRKVVTFMFKDYNTVPFKVTANAEILVENFNSSPLNTVGICSVKQIYGNSFEWRRQ